MECTYISVQLYLATGAVQATLPSRQILGDTNLMVAKPSFQDTKGDKE